MVLCSLKINFAKKCEILSWFELSCIKNFVTDPKAQGRKSTISGECSKIVGSTTAMLNLDYKLAGKQGLVRKSIIDCQNKNLRRKKENKNKKGYNYR